LLIVRSVEETRLPREFGTVGNGTIDSTIASKL